MRTTRTAGFLLILALAAPAAGAQISPSDTNAPQVSTDDTVTMQNLLEFGPTEDREVLRRRSRERFMARHPAGRALESKNSAPAVTARLLDVEPYEPSGDLTLAAEVVPSSETESVRLMVRRPGDVTYTAVPMRLTAPGRFSVTIGPEYTRRDYLKLYLEAELLAGGEPVQYGSDKEPILVTARAAAAEGMSLWILAVPLGIIVALQVARRRAGGIAWPAFRAARPHVPHPSLAPNAHHAHHSPHSDPLQPAAPPHENPRLEMNPYQVLRIQRTATPREIADAYCLMRKLNFYGTVRDSLPLIDLAHELLMDPESRREVDEALRHGGSAAEPAAARLRAATMKEAGP